MPGLVLVGLLVPDAAVQGRVVGELLIGHGVSVSPAWVPGRLVPRL